MRTLLGIDVGTSSIKAMLLDVQQGVIAVKKSEYDVSIPDTDRAEQSPEIWWEGLVKILNEFRLDVKTKEAFEAVAGIGFSGQMHGLVCIDKEGNPVCPAIIWLDQRSRKVVKEINEQLSQDIKKDVLHNQISAGFAFPSLLWMKKYEPVKYEKIYKIFQPKDFIRYRMTEEIGTDVTDASATGMFHLSKREWAWEIIEKFGLKKEIFPLCHESGEYAGSVSRRCSEATGLKEGIPVVFGCGDQMAQSVGNGVYRERAIISNIGTGGQVSAYSNTDVYDRQLRTNTFCHAIGKGYSVFGATLNCGNSLKWMCRNFFDSAGGYDRCNELAADVPAGSEGVIYLPYLSGERTPIMDANAKGIIFGMKLEHDKRHILRASMEGMIYSLKDCLCLLWQMGVDSEEIIASGGGAYSELMLQMQADIFERNIKVCDVCEQACLGACIIAGDGLGIFDIEWACRKYVTFNKRVFIPNTENAEIYRNGFEVYHKLYEKTKDLMV